MNPTQRAEYCANYYKANRAKMLATTREWQKANPERFRDHLDKWRKANREKIRANVSRWKKNNPEKVRAQKLRWRKTNPDSVKASKARRRAHKAKAPGAKYTTAAHIQGRWELWGNCCYICNSPATATDHVIPLAKGGSHWPANLRPICTACNCRKNAKPLATFLNEIS